MTCGQFREVYERLLLADCTHAELAAGRKHVRECQECCDYVVSRAFPVDPVIRVLGGQRAMIELDEYFSAVSTDPELQEIEDGASWRISRPAY